MAKLDEATAKATAEATTGWEMTPGDYIAQLTEVKTHDKNGDPLLAKKSGNPKWEWVLTLPDDANEGRYKRRKLTRHIGLDADSAGLRKEAFAAFGADPATTDTDDLVAAGARCIIVVDNKEWNGELSASIVKMLPLPDGAAPIAGSKGKGKNESAKF